MQWKHSIFPYRYSCLRKSEQDVQSENCVLCQAVPSKAIKLEIRYETVFDPQLPARYRCCLCILSLPSSLFSLSVFLLTSLCFSVFLSLSSSLSLSLSPSLYPLPPSFCPSPSPPPSLCCSLLRIW